MSTVEELKFLRLILLSYDTSLNVIRGFTEIKVLSKHHGKLSEFFEHNMHDIYHLWKNYTPCCKCGGDIIKKKSQVLGYAQIESVFDLNGTEVKEHIKWNNASKSKTECLCKVSVKPRVKLENMDITLIHILLKNFAQLEEDEKMWLKTIKEKRNKLSHVTSTTHFDEGKLDRWWTRLESSILGLASKFPISSYESAIKKNIDLLKTKQFSADEVKAVVNEIQEHTGKVINSLKEHAEKQTDEILQKQVEYKCSIQESVSEATEKILGNQQQQISDLKSQMADMSCGINKILKHLTKEEQSEVKEFQKLSLESMKEEVTTAIHEGKERFLLVIDNIVVMVACCKMQSALQDDNGDNEKLDFAGALEGPSGSLSKSNNQIETREDVCKVEWKVVTPGTWDVEKIAETMNQLAALLNETIKIRFVRTGSLILSTTVPCNIMKDRNQFHTAVHSLFVKIVEVCDLDVEKPNTIKAFLSVEYPIVQKTTKTLVIHTTVPTRIFKDRDLLLATSESFLTRMFQKCRIDTEQYELVKIGMDVKDIPHSSKKITGSKSTVSITEPTKTEAKEINLHGAQSAPTAKQKESKEKHLFASKDEVPWKFRFGFKRLISLKDKAPNDLVMTFDRYKEAFSKALNEKDMRTNKETVTLLLRCLSKCCECESLTEQTKEVFSVLEKSAFLNEHAVQFIEDMATKNVKQSLKDEYKNSVRDLLKVLLKLRSLVPKSRIVVMGIYSFIDTPINVMRSETDLINDEIWELFLQLQQGKQQINQESNRKSTGKNETGVVNFREFPTFPTTEEIQAAISPQILPNKVSGGYTDLDHYLDVQYKLLREDFVAPLRESIRDYIEATNSATPLKRSYNFTMYYDVQVISPICNYHGLCRRLSFNCKEMNKIRWESSKRLIYGSLVCLSHDNFQTVWFATVTERDLKNIRKGLVDVKFEKEYDEVSSISPDTIFVMAETTAYFEAYKHVMLGMQKIKSGDLPFERHIVHGTQIVNEPLYIKRNTGVKYDLRPLVDEDVRLSDPSLDEYEQYKFSKVSTEARSVEITKTEAWPSAELLHLDESQLKALRNALTKEFALIQGPPGTGKTYLGVKIIKTLLHNRHVWNRNITTEIEEKRPILVICYTNHALDQFLEEIVKCYSGDVLRLGNRSSNDAMKPLSINNKRMTMRLEKSVHSSKMDIKHNLCLIMEKVNTISLGIERAKRDILHEDTLHEAMGTFYSKLISGYEAILLDMYGTSQKKRNRKNFCVMLEWLGFGKILGFESTDESENRTVGQGHERVELEGVLSISTHESVNSNYINVLDENDADIAERFYATNEIFEDDDDEKNYRERLNDSEISLSSFPVALDLSNIENFQKETLVETFLPQKPIQKAGKWKKKIRKKLLSSDRMTINEVENITDVWDILPDERWRLYRYWLDLLCSKLEESIREKEIEFDKTCRKYHEILMQEDKAIMKNSTIIGLTTTCAARYQSVLQEIGPKIIIVEEAAEVLEGHIISSLSRNCEHLILIGDHKQLKPKPTVYKLGKDYNLNLSLFERMANNDVELHCLVVQHRMNPTISEIMRIIYPNLEDHDMVKHQDPVRGISENVYFIDHSEPESYEKDLRSRSNQYEADYLVRLCRYFLTQGYRQSQITVLTTYSGQLFALKYKMPKSEFNGVRVTVVDNYQGEENDIVLLSLVRSNEDGNIGFLQEDNRTCVALSRARKGLYVIGNFNMLADKSDLWRKIVDHAKKNHILGSKLHLVCPYHKDSTYLVEHLSDFDRLIDVRCKRKCGYLLPCGHTCPNPCHLEDVQHKNVVCNAPCLKNCAMGHKCEKKCNEKCGRCEVQIEKLHPNCGHRQILPCYLDKKDSKYSEQCNRMSESVGSCGHVIKHPCHLKENSKESQRLCSEPCNITLKCGHVCQGTCGECRLGRIHRRCSNICNRTLLCGHECTEVCNICSSCNQKCQNECAHKTCPDICAVDCIPCVEICTWQCQHYTCTEICSSPCNRPRCDEPCRKVRTECGHVCSGLCGEPCPDVCISCLPLSELILTNSKPNRGMRFVQLEDCPHIIEVNYLNGLMDDTQNGKIGLKSCPSCKTPIRRTRRYGRSIKETLHHIEIIKQRILGSKSSIYSLEKTIRHELSTMEKGNAEKITQNFETLTIEFKDEETLRTISVQIELIKSLQALRDEMGASSITFPQYRELFEQRIEEIGILITFISQSRRYFTQQEIDDISTENCRLRLSCEIVNYRVKTDDKSPQNPFPSELDIKLHKAVGYLADGKRLSEQRAKDIIKTLDDFAKFFRVRSRGSWKDDDCVRLSPSRNLSSADWFLCIAGHIYSEYDAKSSMCPECYEEYKEFR